MTVLWPHQLRTCTEIDRSWEQHRMILVCSPTGSGKTVMGSQVAEVFVADGQRVTFLLPRIELVRQFCKKIDEWLPFGYGLITANSRGGGGQDLYKPIQVASVDTLVERAVKNTKLTVPPADLIVLDEVHLFDTALRKELILLFGPHAKILGLSATPARPNGRGLSLGFTKIIEAATVKELIRDGYLVKPIYYAPQLPDLEQARVTAGEWNKQDVEVAMEPLVGGIVESWMRFGEDQPTIVFADSVKHSLFLRDEFLAAGISAEHVDAKTPDTIREGVFDRLANGETQVLVNMGIATYGIDVPVIGCVVLAVPTKSGTKFMQMGGRGMRIAEGKSHLIVIDHAGNIHEHGYLEDDRHWTLEGYVAPAASRQAARKKRKKGENSAEAPRQLTCPTCSQVFRGSLTCPCGYYFEGMARQFHVVEGELVAYNTDDESNIFARVKFYCELMQYAADGGKKPGWCDHTYFARFKKWPQPRWREFALLPPSRETLRYIRYRNIQWAKGRQNEARRARG